MTFTAEPTRHVSGGGRRQSRLETIERLIRMADVSGVIAGHPLSDLTGANPVEIANALAAAILAAHAEGWPSPLDDRCSYVRGVTRQRTWPSGPRCAMIRPRGPIP
jgi:hypothetical protein